MSDSARGTAEIDDQRGAGTAAAAAGGATTPGAPGGLGAPRFSSDDLVGQLNAWAAQVDHRLDEVTQGVAEVRGSAMIAAARLSVALALPGNPNGREIRNSSEAY